jgi:hypothetical protein
VKGVQECGGGDLRRGLQRGLHCVGAAVLHTRAGGVVRHPASHGWRSACPGRAEGECMRSAERGDTRSASDGR